ncbi:MAG: TIGR04086 family membrane protein [Clostridiales bacterium]|nr:TIGR04086 family membrane protein [Clostridiales bacterium]
MGRYFKIILKGLLISIIITFAFLLVLSLIMVIFDLPEDKYNFIFGLISIIALVIGSVISAKYNEKKGFITGGVLGILFFIFIFLLSSIINGDMSFDTSDVIRFFMYFFVGTVSGILGVNM